MNIIRTQKKFLPLIRFKNKFLSYADFSEYKTPKSYSDVNREPYYKATRGSGVSIFEKETEFPEKQPKKKSFYDCENESWVTSRSKKDSWDSYPDNQK